MAAQAQKSRLDGELLDRLLTGRDPATVLSSGGLLGELKKVLAKRMLNAELDVHLETAGRARGRQSPQRRQREDGADGGRSAEVGDPPRSASEQFTLGNRGHGKTSS